MTDQHRHDYAPLAGIGQELYGDAPYLATIHRHLQTAKFDRPREQELRDAAHQALMNFFSGWQRYFEQHPEAKTLAPDLTFEDLEPGVEKPETINGERVFPVTLMAPTEKGDKTPAENIDRKEYQGKVIYNLSPYDSLKVQGYALRIPQVSTEIQRRNGLHNQADGLYQKLYRNLEMLNQWQTPKRTNEEMEELARGQEQEFLQKNAKDLALPTCEYDLNTDELRAIPVADPLDRLSKGMSFVTVRGSFPRGEKTIYDGTRMVKIYFNEKRMREMFQI
ncbi:MAG: hypothetical protein HYZ51_04170 [Candidatus Doudnabacteria bacterium]|nr:hypothetical protein [Candidatus Doudnabacteria bacterium]